MGDEALVRTIHVETKLPNASIKPLKARKSISEIEVWWNWQTERTIVQSENPDDELRALLLAYRPIFPKIKKHQGEADIYLELVTQYEEGEEPQGFYLSAETVQLLCEMGGALDNDVVIVPAGSIRKISDGSP